MGHFIFSLIGLKRILFTIFSKGLKAPPRLAGFEGWGSGFGFGAQGCRFSGAKTLNPKPYKVYLSGRAGAPTPLEPRLRLFRVEDLG